MIKHKVAQKIEREVTKEVNKLVDENKSGAGAFTKKQRENLLHWKKNEICEAQAVSFSLFFNNIIYLTLVLVFSFFVLKNMAPLYNLVGTTLASSSLLFLLSTSSSK